MKIPKWENFLKDKLTKEEAQNLIDFANAEIHEWKEFIKQIKLMIK